MSRYSELIGQINSDINTNGHKQITGAKLNSALNAMVSVLGSGYRIAGEIAPNSAAPTDPENGMCYIAQKVGRYVNFGGLDVESAEIAFICYNGTEWKKIGWRKNDYGLVVISEYNEDGFSDEEMEELKKHFAVVVGTDGQLFYKVGDGESYIIFATIPSLSAGVGFENTINFYQQVLRVHKVKVSGVYQYGFEEIFDDVFTTEGVFSQLSGKQDALTWDSTPTANSTNPVTSGGIATAISGFITKAVDDLTNYYLKSETYTQAEVNALIGAIQQFHYEIYPTLPQTGQSNVLYLIGPTGSGSDRYEEYVYSNNAFTKIGDTSIDLSNYYTKSQTDAAFAPIAKGVPTGGTTGQVLVKHSNTDNDVEWGNAGGEQIQSDWNQSDNTKKDYIKNKPTIPDVSNYVQKSNTAGLLKNDGTVDTTSYGTYSKPSGGIPASDLASGVIPTVPVQDVTVGGTSVVSSGTAVIPAIPDVSGKENTSNKVTSFQATPDDTHYPSEKLVKDSLDTKLSSTDVEALTAIDVDNTPTANSSNLVTSGGVYSEVHPALGTSMPSGGFLPNVVYNLSSVVTGTVTWTMAAASDNNIANIWYWSFDTDSIAPTITWPQAITAWNGGSAPTINASKHYEVSVMNGIACIIEV